MKLNYENIFWGNHWTYWVGFYDFIFNELFVEKIKEYASFTKYLNAVQEVHLFIPFENIVFISDNPTSITLDSQGRLHHEEAPAMMYEDGYSLFYMNGIQVPKRFIETKRADINPKEVLALQNTEQRMVLMRYVGLANYLKDLNAKEIHSYKDYKLYYLTVENQEIGPYIYMKCPSSGREFLEGCGDHQTHELIDTSYKNVSRCVTVASNEGKQKTND